jgi:hypothetical protein
MSLNSRINIISRLRNDSSLEVPNDDYIVESLEPNGDQILSKKKTKKSLNDILEDTNKIISDTNIITFGESDDFDLFLDDFNEDDEDLDLKNSIISFGRKYSRKHEIDENESEITKAFAPQEKELDELLKEINNDKKLIQEDIRSIRATRIGSNRKALTEMVEVKNQMHNAALAVIKEKNSLKKNKFDIIIKLNNGKNNKNNGDGEFLDPGVRSNKMVQSILNGDNYVDLINSVGGRSSVSGAITSSDNNIDHLLDYDENDDYVQKTYFNKNSDFDESDGDKFVKYEKRGVHYVLLLDSANTPQKIFAEDKDGNIISDYPTPDKIEELMFDIEKDSMSATDQLNRQYEIRMI